MYVKKYKNAKWNENDIRNYFNLFPILEAHMEELIDSLFARTTKFG